MKGPISLAREAPIVGRSVSRLGERRSGASRKSSPNAAGRFFRRARLYGALDTRLGATTRFFGAACVTNLVLGHWASVGRASAPIDSCVGWLSELGASLETVNHQIARAVRPEWQSGHALDARIVSIEQTVVENFLRRGKNYTTSGPSPLLRALDAVMNDESWLCTLHFSAAVRWYRGVLAGVRNDLRTPIEFARQPHREKIGMALIGALNERREGEPVCLSWLNRRPPV